MTLTQDEIIKLKESQIEGLSGQIGELTSKLIGLQKELKDKEAELELIEQGRSAYLEDMKKFNAEADARIDERQNELNEFHARLCRLESAQQKESDRLNKWNEDLATRNADLIQYAVRLEQRQADLDRIRGEIAEEKTAVEQERVELAKSTKDITQKMLEVNVLSDKYKTQEAQLLEAVNKMETTRAKLDAGETMLVTMTAAVDTQMEEVRIKRLELDELVINLNAREAVVSQRENKIKEREQFNQRELQQINDEKMRLELGWLQVNERAKQKQVEIDLEKLKRGE